MCDILNEVLSKAEGFTPVPTPRQEGKIVTFPWNERHKQYVQCPEQDCENLVYHYDQSLSMIEVLKLHETDEWKDRVKAFYAWYRKSESKNQSQPWTWEGKDSQKWSRGSSKRAQSVPSSPADRPDPVEERLAWYDIGEANIEESFLYPNRGSDEDCPVVKQQMMDKGEQQKYMQWIEKILDLDRRTTKDERLYCGYCDMNNHPRFSCKRFKKHRDENAHHRCTLCIAEHAPFQCSRAQCNGGCTKPNWARLECKLAKGESRSPNFR